jgi:hypothetical protein
MKYLWASVLLFAALGYTALAASAIEELVPDRPHGSTSVNVSSRRLANGDIEFSILITQKWPYRYHASLGIVRERENLGLGSSRGLRSLPADESEGVTKCVFSVTPKELENPDLSFRVTHGGDMWLHTYFIPLRKYLPLKPHADVP